VLETTTSLESFSRIIAPLLGGWIIAVHPTWLGWLCGMLYIVAVAIALRVNAPEISAQTSPANES
jgi:hypothetical protein